MSLSLKGVAILMMLYFHLFNEVALCELTSSNLQIGELPFLYILARLTHPVEMFVILSGYGLYTVMKRGKYNVVRKIQSLYIHYWLSLLIFIPIGALIVGTDVYPGSWSRLFSNITGWYTNWNVTMWFLFPYALLAITSPYIFKVMDKSNPYVYICIVFVMSLGGQFLVSRYGSSFLYGHQLVHMPIIYFNLLFSFSMGAYLVKYDILSKISIDGRLCWGLLILISVCKCCISTGALHSLYSIALIVLFAKANRPIVLDKFLQEMGRRSTSMWFAHAYFCYYYCKEFIYSFQNPIIIYAVLLVCSYMSAVAIDYINKKIQCLVFRQ